MIASTKPNTAIQIAHPRAMTASILSSHRRMPPYGMAGGEPGECGHNWVERADGKVDELGGVDETQMAPGDVFVIQTPTGGGYGPAGGTAEDAP